MNPFAALAISDDEDDKFTKTTGGEQKPPKKSKRVIMQPTNRGSRSRRPRSRRPKMPPDNQPQSLTISPNEPKKTPARSDITRSSLPRKFPLLATISTAAAEPAESTDPERKVEAEEVSVISKTSSTRTSTSKREKKEPKELLLNSPKRKSQNNLKESLLTSTIATKVLKSTP